VTSGLDDPGGYPGASSHPSQAGQHDQPPQQVSQAPHAQPQPAQQQHRSPEGRQQTSAQVQTVSPQSQSQVQQQQTAAEAQGMGMPRPEDVISELGATDQLTMLQQEEESLIKQRRQLQELLYKLTIEEISLKQPK